MANIAKRADGHRRARYRDAHGKEHARHSTERLTPRTGWTRSRPQCRPASTSTQSRQDHNRGLVCALA